MKYVLQNKKKLFTILVIIFALSGYVLSYYFYSKYQALTKTPDQVTQKQAVKITSQVAKLMQLPTDETPNVVKVSDKSKLESQPFFKDSENGDILLVYSKNLKAILYRPSTDKIIQVGPIYNDNVVQTNVATTSASLKIALYNGSGTIGATQNPLKLIRDKMPVTVVSQAKASSTVKYPKTLVVNVSGTHADEARQMADLLNATVSALPKGETKPSADILVIVGND